MIIGTVRILPPPGRRGAVIEVLRSVQGPVRAQPGCVACDVFDEQGPEPAVVLLERWETTEAFEQYLRSEADPRLIAVIETVGRMRRIRFEHVERLRAGVVQRLRNRAGPSSGQSMRRRRVFRR